MFDDPAYPSVPPPPEDDSVRPMSFLAAFLWSMGAQLLFVTTILLLGGASEWAGWNPVTRISCQAVAYLLVLFFTLRVYAPTARIRDFVAFRSTQWAMAPLALLLGASVAFPIDWVFAQLQPDEPDHFFGFLDVFFRMTMPERIAAGVAIAALGPVVEELIFRGALFTSLRKRYPPGAVMAGTGLLFAAVHLNPLAFVPLVVLGTGLGYLRWASGTIVVPLLMHAAYNGVGVYELLRIQSPSESTPTPLTHAGIGLAVALASLGLIYLLSRTQPARAARRADE